MTLAICNDSQYQQCKDCKRTLLLTSFHKSGDRKGSYTRQCLECRQKIIRKNAALKDIELKKLVALATNFDDLKNISKGPIEAWASKKLRNIRSKCKKEGIKCTLTLQDLIFASCEYCPALGVKLVYTRGDDYSNRASIDRLDPDGGYVPSNIAVISAKANRSKNNLSLHDYKKIIDNVYEHSFAEQDMPCVQVQQIF